MSECRYWQKCIMLILIILSYKHSFFVKRISFYADYTHKFFIRINLLYGQQNICKTRLTNSNILRILYQKHVYVYLLYNTYIMCYVMMWFCIFLNVKVTVLTYGGTMSYYLLRYWLFYCFYAFEVKVCCLKTR